MPDSVGDLVHLASSDPRIRFAAEDRLRAAGSGGRRALARLLDCDGVPDGLRDRAADLLGSLVRESAVETFRAAVPETGDVDLWTGAIAIGAEGRPGLDVAAEAARLDALVEEARRVVPPEGDAASRAAALTACFRDGLGFRGDVERYGDVRNSYLPDVLDRRLGIPVTLAVVWIAIARRLGLLAAGVGLPLHFVARCDGAAEPVFVDAFHGAVLDRDGCRRLVARVAGRDVALPDSVFRPMRPREVLVRMLRNLRAVHVATGNAHAALGAEDRILHLTPLEPLEWRERAALLARLDRPAAAARSLSRALALDPGVPERGTIERQRRALQERAAARN